MARLWIAYRDGLRLRGRPVATVAFESSIAKLDLASWRRFADSPPDEIDEADLAKSSVRKRALVEVLSEDLEELSAFSRGLYESPYSPEEALRRIGRSVREPEWIA